jgi:hypothetical protein
MHWFFFRGDQGPANGGSGNNNNGSRGGWAYKDGSFENGNGDHGSWQTALENYLNNGTCTPGWDIYVDGFQVCDASA